WVTFHWAGRDSFLVIADDGLGMSDQELLGALTVGSRDPRAVREVSDLGRFGLGLKTASFSQARRLTVASRDGGGEDAIYRWDLDYVGEVNDWRLLRGTREGSRERICVIEELASGTAVLLENLDRVVGQGPASDRRSHGQFLANVDRVEQHLAMVFHRYI